MTTHNTHHRKPVAWLPLAARLFLGAVFLYASADKLFFPADFARAVYNYQILPDSLINLTALILPWLEFLLGLCLITGVWLPGALLWSNSLLWAFFLALLFNHYRGLDVDCGCFSSRLNPAVPPPTAWYMARDPFFLLVAGYLLFRQLAGPNTSVTSSKKELS